MICHQRALAGVLNKQTEAKKVLRPRALPLPRISCDRVGKVAKARQRCQNMDKIAKTRQGPIGQGNLDLSLNLMQSWCDWLPPFIQMGKIPLYNQDRLPRKQSKGVMAYYWWWIRLTWNISGPNGLVCGLCGRITACSSRRVSKESCHVV